MVKNTYPKRGELWWVDFGNRKGGIINKTRPAIIVSNNTSNKYSNKFQVIPITSNTNRIYKSELLIYVKSKKGKAMVDQLLTVEKKKVYEKIGEVTSRDMFGIERVIKIQLGFK